MASKSAAPSWFPKHHGGKMIMAARSKCFRRHFSMSRLLDIGRMVLGIVVETSGKHLERSFEVLDAIRRTD